MKALLRLPLVLGFLLGLLLCGHARADSCSITPANFAFPDVSSISTSDVFTSSSFQVTCTWADFSLGNLLTPNVTVCLYLGAGTNSSTTVTAPRTIGNGALRVNYNIYTDATYAAAKIWGGWAGTSTSSAANAIIFTMTKTGGVGTISQNVSLFGKLNADATLAAVAVGNTNLSFTSSFGAGSGLMQYIFFLTGTPSCALGPILPISFQVQANVINDCNINIGNLVFPNSSILNSAVRTTSSLSVQCSNSTAYKIVFSAGTYGSSATARMMRNQANSDQVAYQISNVLDGTSLGDGTSGTVVLTGTGDGTSHSQTLYGLVPVQTTPSPGDYKDTITATVLF